MERWRFALAIVLMVVILDISGQQGFGDSLMGFKFSDSLNLQLACQRSNGVGEDKILYSSDDPFDVKGA